MTSCGLTLDIQCLNKFKLYREKQKQKNKNSMSFEKEEGNELLLCVSHVSIEPLPIVLLQLSLTKMLYTSCLSVPVGVCSSH